MKKWNKPEFEALEITATANGKHSHKFEGIDGVDAHGEYNKYINKNGTGTFTVPTGDDNDNSNNTDVTNELS